MADTNNNGNINTPFESFTVSSSNGVTENMINSNDTNTKGTIESELSVSDHFNIKSFNNRIIPDTSLISPASHFTNDPNSPNPQDNNRAITTRDFDGVLKPVNSGSTTRVNPFGDYNKKDIIERGLCNNEADRVVKETNNSQSKVPISPLYPFTRLNPDVARTSMFTTYNRIKLPIVDTEYRKGFRHVFFTRPECYIMSNDSTLSEQCSYDEDFSSCFSRMPHILKILSPVYVTSSYSKNNINSNWNYLLCNRVVSMQSAIKTGSEPSQQHALTPLGYSVIAPSYVTSMSNSTLSVTFSETKNLEVYEMLRMWMLYNHKRKYGIFSPPYNGYAIKNGFLSDNQNGGLSGEIQVKDASRDEFAGVLYHPYDRALENCASIFEIYTNESMTKILYWCKYYGVYPEEASIEGFGSDVNKAATADGGLKCNASFRYQRKLECVNKTLVEFNYNAGITDNMGRVKSSLSLNASYPFLLRSEDEIKLSSQLATSSDVVLPNYIGASGMFTGSPYIVMGETTKDPLNPAVTTISPYLMFTSLSDSEFNNELNLGIENNRKQDTSDLIGVK